MAGDPRPRRLLGTWASPPLYPISLISVVVDPVYLADVRPAVRDIRPAADPVGTAAARRSAGPGDEHRRRRERHASATAVITFAVVASEARGHEQAAGAAEREHDDRRRPSRRARGRARPTAGTRGRGRARAGPSASSEYPTRAVQRPWRDGHEQVAEDADHRRDRRDPGAGGQVVVGRAAHDRARSRAIGTRHRERRVGGELFADRAQPAEAVADQQRAGRRRAEGDQDVPTDRSQPDTRRRPSQWATTIAGTATNAWPLTDPATHASATARSHRRWDAATSAPSSSATITPSRWGEDTT